MCLGRFRYRAVPFDQIIEEVQSGAAPPPGLLIHEGQLTYESQGLEEGSSTSASGGCWRRACRCRSARTWLGATSAPRTCSSCPTCCASRSRRGSTTATRRWSTRCSSGAASTPSLPTASWAMYVNELTCDYGDEGRQAVRRAADARRGARRRTSTPSGSSSSVSFGAVPRAVVLSLVRTPVGRYGGRARPASGLTTSPRSRSARPSRAPEWTRRDRGRLLRLREPGR